MSNEEPVPDVHSRVRELAPAQRAELARRLRERRTAGPRPRRPGESPVLSYEQERLWLLDQLTPGLVAYNASRVLRLEGPLDTSALQRALAEIVARHEVLRTRVTAVDGRAAASIAPPQPVSFEVVDIDARDGVPRDASDPGRGRAGAAVPLIRSFLGRPFDLARDQLLRSLLVRVAPDEHVLALCVHHIASDGASRKLLLDEFGALYVAYEEGATGPVLDPPALQFSDVAAWQRRAFEGKPIGEHSDFWTRYLAGAPPTIDLPFDHPRPAVQSYAGERLATRVGPSVVASLREIVRAEGGTPFMGMVAAFAALLSRLSGQLDLVIGTPVNGRSTPELDHVMGMLSDTLPLRIDLTGDPGFSALVRRVRQATGEAFAHREVPFEKIVEIVRPERDPSRPPLLQVLVNGVGSRGSENTAWGDLLVSPVAIDPLTSQVDLSLAIVDDERSGELELIWEWCSALFETESVRRIARRLDALLAAALAEPDRPVSELALLDEGERQELLVAWNATEVPYPSATVTQLVAEQAIARPGAVAVVAPGGSLTYAELEERSSVLAERVAGLGIGRDDRVAVCLDRSVELIIAIIGIMRAGAAYVPVDPTHPADRIAHVMRDAGVRAVITTSAHAAQLPSSPAMLLLISDGAFRADGAAPDSDHRAARPDPTTVGRNAVTGGPSHRDLAYVIYTSGSTGRPKGVMIEHGGLVNLLTEMATRPGIAPGDVMLGVTTPAFDLSVPDLLLPLVVGATLVLADAGAARDAGALGKLIDSCSASVVQATPSTWQMMVEAGWPGRRGLRVVCGGEGYGSALVDALTERVDEVWNFYGPTETTVWSVCTRLEHGAGDPVPMGRPIANTRCYVLDERREPVPVGVVGELYIGGTGVARGYLGRDDLTKERFLADPFSTDPGARLYRTGDLVRWRPDGQLVFVGRSDHQVKLRGFRIELGEIEVAINEAPGVARAVVVAREDSPGNRRLVAYVVPESAPLDLDDLGALLQRRLPAYMVPSAIISLDALPLSANGKLDRSALPSPTTGRDGSAAAVAPGTATEVTLARLWEELTGAGGVRAGDNFFELGGHSLLATRLAARISAELGVAVPLDLIFEQPVLARYAAAVDRYLAAPGVSAETPPIERADRASRAIPAGTYPLAAGSGSDGTAGLVAFPASYAQERMWVLEQLEPTEALYNVPIARRLTGPLDLPALSGALDRLVRHHEVLRTALVESDGIITQVVHPRVDVEVTTLDVARDADPWAAAVKAVIGEARRPFDLARAPLFRVCVVNAGTSRSPEDQGDRPGTPVWLLCLTAHHGVIDGASVEQLVTELRAEYEGIAAGALSRLHEGSMVDYGDVVLWQRGPAMSAVESGDLDYWRDTLAGAPTSLDFPFDRPRPAVPSHRGGRTFHRIDAGLTRDIRKAAARTSATTFMTVLAGWVALLARYSGQEDVVVGVPVSGRTRPEMHGVIGLFVNSLPVRISTRDDLSFDELVRRTRTALLDGMSHQHVPFERIVDAVLDGRDLSRHPVFQVLATIQSAAPSDEPFGEARMSPVPIDWGWSRFADMSLVVVEREEELDLALEHSADLLDPRTAQRLCSQLEELLRAAVADGDSAVSEIVFDAADRRKTVGEWSSTTRSYPADRCIHELVAERAASTPDAAAVELAGETLTYAELLERSGRIAARLRALGVGRDVVVGVCVDRSFDMVASLLAVLESGGAYLPLDPTHPTGRIAYILGDAHVSVLITTSDVAPRIATEGEARLLLDAIDGDGAAAEARGHAVAMDDLAYVIYTSGSTGYPKGTLVEHHGVVNLAYALGDVLGLNATTRFLQFATLAFDASVLEILVVLSLGGTVVLAPSEVVASSDDLLRLLDSERISAALLPPSLLAVLPDAELPHLRTLCSGGEACSAQVLRRWGRGRRMVNAYGPTEITVVATTYVVDSGPDDDPLAGRPAHSSAPIGRPIANVEVYVLDARLRPVPIGCPGELYVGGAGVARGYLGKPELTAERFVGHPFSGESGARLYRTGDRVRWLPDGNLEYLGRLDDQVKLRGYRIELGEIEHTLVRHPLVTDAVASVREVAGTSRLVAHVVAAPGVAQPTPGELRTHARRTLPEYMVPSNIVVLDAWPITPTGKIDRAALPSSSEPPGTHREYIAPEGPLEELVASLWREVLGSERIGAHDDVFELGANSLDAARVASKLRSHSIDLPLRDLFDHPTIRSIARTIVGGLAADSPDLEELLALAERETP